MVTETKTLLIFVYHQQFPWSLKTFLGTGRAPYYCNDGNGPVKSNASDINEQKDLIAKRNKKIASECHMHMILLEDENKLDLFGNPKSFTYLYN